MAEGQYVRLYQYTDGIKSRFFIQEKDQKPYELKNYVFLSKDDTRTVLNNAIYKGQLSLLATNYNPGNDKIKDPINRSEYTAYSLTKIVALINNQSVKLTRADNSTVRLIAGVGINRTQTFFKGDHPLAGYKSVQYEPIAGIGIDYINNKDVQKTILRVELLFSQISPAIIAQDVETNQWKAIFKQRTITLYPQAIFNLYNKSAFKYFVGVGVGANYSSYPENTYTIMHGTTPQGQSTLNFNKFWFNAGLETGIAIYKKVEILAKYLPAFSYANYQNFDVSTNYINLTTHYLF